MHKRILILGGGFAGAYTALHLERLLAGVPDIEIVLAAKENFVLFTPMLREVAASEVESKAFDLPYDQLVPAPGTVPNFHRTPGIEEHALTMKTLGDGIPGAETAGAVNDLLREAIHFYPNLREDNS